MHRAQEEQDEIERLSLTLEQIATLAAQVTHDLLKEHDAAVLAGQLASPMATPEGLARRARERLKRS